jgi:hypothetical protein
MRRVILVPQPFKEGPLFEWAFFFASFFCQFLLSLFVFASRDDGSG